MITDATTISELAEIVRRNGGRLRSLIIECDGGKDDRVLSVCRTHDGTAASAAYVGGNLAAAISASLAKAGAR